MPLQAYLDTFPELAEGVFSHETAQIIGDVTIGRDSSIWCNTVLRGDVNRITIGECSNVQDFAMCHVSHKTPSKPEGSPLKIGDSKATALVEPVSLINFGGLRLAASAVTPATIINRSAKDI